MASLGLKEAEQGTVEKAEQTINAFYRARLKERIATLLPRWTEKVLSDRCEPVSARTVALSLMPRQVGATRQERLHGSA